MALPRNIRFGSVLDATPVNFASFQSWAGNISTGQGTSAIYTLSAAANASGGNTTYTGSGFGGTNNLTGATITITGFVTNAANNGTFVVQSNTTTTIVLNNPAGVSESVSAKALQIGWVLTQATVSGGSVIYTGTIVGQGAAATTNAYVGYVFNITGFTNVGNNGRFVCTANTSTTLTLTNAGGVNETHAGNALMQSGVSWAISQCGYVQTTDRGQAVWNTLGLSGNLTSITNPATVITGTTNVAHGFRAGQVVTITGTTHFNGSYILATAAGSSFTISSVVGAGQTDSAGGQTAQVLALTLTGGGTTGSTTGAYPTNNLSSYTLATNTFSNYFTKFRGIFAAGTVYNNGDVVWNTSSDPNNYITKAQATWSVTKASQTSTTATYITTVAHNLVAGEHVTVLGCTTSSLNVTNAVLATASGSTFTITLASATIAAELETGATVTVVPTNDSTTANNHWMPYVYEIWESNDGLTNYFFKMEYGQSSTNTVGLWITYGASSDGLGNIPMPSTFREPITSNTGGILQAVSESNFYGVGSGSDMWLLLGRTQGSGGTVAMFLHERSKSNAGADTGTYLTYIVAGSSNTTLASFRQNSFVFSPPLNGNAASIPYIPVNAGVQTTTNGGGVDNGVFTNFCGNGNVALTWRVPPTNQTITSVSFVSTTATYLGNFPTGSGTGSQPNQYVGWTITIAGFTTHPGNNGTFVVLSNTGSQVVVTNANASTGSESGGSYTGTFNSTGNGNIAVAPIFPLVGLVDNPLTLMQVVNKTDALADGTTFTCAVYGNSRTYMSIQTAVSTWAQGLTTYQQSVGALLWEP